MSERLREGLEIRESAPGDLASIEALYPEAFPDEDLLPLVRDLLQEAPVTLSLVGMIGASLAGHIVFTRCGVGGCGESLALLGPLAIAPAFQRQGVGSAMIRAGLREQEDAGVTQVYVLGDPAYYGRFGFLAERRVEPPYPLPADWRDAWQSLGLGAADQPREGRLSVPQPWRQQALWAP